MGNLKYIKKMIGELKDDELLELQTDLLADLDDDTPNEAEEMNLVLMGDFTDAAQERYKSFGKMQGLSSGYPKIDDLTHGFAPGELVIVAGKTSRGKTTLALNISNKLALQDKTVLFVTLEMTHDEITQRMMFINDCTEDNLTDDYFTAAGHIAFQKTDELNWNSIDKLMEKAKVEMNVDLVVIDHLHYFTRELTNVAEDLGRITKEFKKNAIRHGVPVLLISHVRKTGNDSEATMEDLRGSSYMAQDADIVLMVGRNDKDPLHTFVKIEKNRNRGFDYERNVVQLYTDRIKISNDDPVDIPDFNEAHEKDDELDALELDLDLDIGGKNGKVSKKTTN